TTTAAEHAHRHDGGAPGGTGHALGVVGHRGDRAGHVGAVPARTVAAVVVARIARVGVAAVAVAGHGGVVDEVVTARNVGVEVGVADVAGVEHGDDDAAAVGDVPGLVGADAGVGVEVAPLLAVAAVVGRQGVLQQ